MDILQRESNQSMHLDLTSMNNDQLKQLFDLFIEHICKYQYHFTNSLLPTKTIRHLLSDIDDTYEIPRSSKADSSRFK